MSDKSFELLPESPSPWFSPAGEGFLYDLQEYREHDRIVSAIFQHGN
ncbi:hypothetical protein [Leptodesmis sichuanensis]|nr:hypothetical protein [Leptodesmis sichuanensis]UIE38025.1 hypothetical protein KIK02_24515 [Leptodesmis sichuanensis A121]